MSELNDQSFLNSSQFVRSSTATTTTNRPGTVLPAKNGNDMFKIGMEHRNQIEICTNKRLIRHNIHIPTELRVNSPPLLTQPTPTPDLCSTVDQYSPHILTNPKPVRIKSATLTIPQKSKSEEILSKNFPKQFHEKRKISEERKRKKQQAQKYLQDDGEKWFQLRESLAELKRLATTQQILVDPSTSVFNCDGYSFDALKAAVKQQQQNKKFNRFKSESGFCSSMETIRSFNHRSRTSLTTSNYSRINRPITEIYPRPIYEPLFVTAKPIHPMFLNEINNLSRLKSRQTRPSSSASSVQSPSRTRSRPSTTFIEKRHQLTLSDLSNHDEHSISRTPSPHVQLIKHEHEEEEEEQQQQQQQTKRKTEIVINNDNQRPESNLSLKSTIKIKNQIPRCRSATEKKAKFSLNKTYPRFILITDQEHRIESWYHQYPFILSDDLIQLFQSKTINKLTVSAYFIDQHQYSTNLTNQTYLQGKPFNINQDWKKYDLIFISNNIYQKIIIYLQTIIRLSGKLIHIYQINHNQDLKSQVKIICKQLYQQISSNN